MINLLQHALITLDRKILPNAIRLNLLLMYQNFMIKQLIQILPQLRITGEYDLHYPTLLHYQYSHLTKFPECSTQARLGRSYPVISWRIVLGFFFGCCLVIGKCGLLLGLTVTGRLLGSV